MFSFDSLTNNEGQKINLNPIYQSINALNENVVSVSYNVRSINGEVDTIKSDVAIINGEIDSVKSDLININSHDVFLFGPNDSWSTLETTNGFLSDIYNKITQGGGGGAELFTALNYNYNANYTNIAFDNITNAATSFGNFKNRIELTGNLNFSEYVVFNNNNNINTIILKNKNINNNFGGSFQNSKNKLLNIEGFKRITDLNLYDVGGDVKIKNCDEMLFNLNCENLKNVNIKNVGVINPGTTNGKFLTIDSLNLNNVSIRITDNLYFEGIKNLNIENATVEGVNNLNNMFGNIVNANFNNVEFLFSSLTTKPFKEVFNNTLDYRNINLNRFDFKNCYLNMPSSVDFAGIIGLIDSCTFNTLNFRMMNDITVNVGNMGEDFTGPLHFNLDSALNNIKINAYAYFDYIFSVSSSKGNTINFENKILDSGATFNFTIEEGPNVKTGRPLNNVYDFINNNDGITMLINYGGTTGGSSYYRHPKIILGKENNVLNFYSPSIELRYNTFDVHFNDIFKASNFIVSDFKKRIEELTDYHTSLWSGFNFNSFNLYFNNNNYETVEYGETMTKPIYINMTSTTTDIEHHTIKTEFKQMDLKFYNLFAYLLGGTLATDNVFESAIFRTCLRLFDGEGQRLTYVN